MERGNLFDGAEAPASGEAFAELCRCGNAVFERIVSSREPEQAVYEQAHDEVVLLVRGSARLEVEGAEHALETGDWMVIPAGRRHRVLETSAGALWFAVHIHPPLTRRDDEE
jgi:cupin 2 domain-containing protein